MISDDPLYLKEALKIHRLSQEEFQRLIECLGRMPTLSELGVFSAMWSEHCSYKSSRVHLKRLPTKGDQVVQGPGENAGIVRLKGALCCAFKMESHNHPSYIDPYQGAATGVGGILRDVFCMGARPIANLNSLRFGETSHPKTDHLQKFAVRGIGDYGNCVGIPTVAGQIAYDASYNGNCLVNAMTVGLIEEDKIFRGFASGKGNLLVYVGSATGRDGIHGASMASDSFDSQTESSERSAVQVGDPFMEKLLMEATLELLSQGLVIGLQDMGAAGLTSSSFEMADRAGSGVLMDLNRVPLRTSGMSAYEILLSESQERMLLVVEPEKLKAVQEVLDRWLLAHDVIGEVTDSGRLQAHFNGKWELDLEIGPLTQSAPLYSRPMTPQKSRSPAQLSCEVSAYFQSLSQEERMSVWKQLLSKNLEHAWDLSWLYRQYDQHIGCRTVLSSEQGGAGVLKVAPFLELGPENPATQPEAGGVAVVATCLERAVAFDSFEGSALSVLKAAKTIAAAGARPLAITDCLNFGNPENPEVMRSFSDSVDGISEACQQLNTPVVSGNVSLYNETDGESILPTPMIGMVGWMEDAARARGAKIFFPTGSSEADEVGGTFYLLTSRSDDKLQQTGFAGSEVAAILNKKGGWLPYVDWEKERALVQALTHGDYFPIWSSCAVRDVGKGGLLATLIKMIPAPGSPSNRQRDWDLTLKTPEGVNISNEAFWCGERAGAYVVAVPACHKSHEIENQVQALLKSEPHLLWAELGTYRVRSSDHDEGQVTVRGPLDAHRILWESKK